MQDNNKIVFCSRCKWLIGAVTVFAVAIFFLLFASEKPKEGLENWITVLIFLVTISAGAVPYILHEKFDKMQEKIDNKFDDMQKQINLEHGKLEETRKEVNERILVYNNNAGVIFDCFTALFFDKYHNGYISTEDALIFFSECVNTSILVYWKSGKGENDVIKIIETVYDIKEKYELKLPRIKESPIRPPIEDMRKILSPKVFRKFLIIYHDLAPEDFPLPKE